MKTINHLLLLCVVFCSVSLLSCSDKDGDWDPMKWRTVSYGTISYQGKSAYFVSAEGGTLQFKCKNYSGFWIDVIELGESEGQPPVIISDAYFDVEGLEDRHSFQNDYVSVKINGSELTVKFGEISSGSRHVKLAVTAGDVFDAFRFVQSAAIVNE